MKTFAINVLIAILVGSPLACSRHDAQERVGAMHPPRTTADLRDMEVLNVVFDDMLTSMGEDSPFFREPPKEILFSLTAVGPPVDFQTALGEIQGDPERPPTELQREALEEALKDLVGRAADGVAFDKFKLKDRRIRIYEEHSSLNKPDQSPGRRSSPISAWSPGYTQDKKFALVRLLIPSDRHHEVGIYLLSDNQGRWTVCFRSFVFYA